jgi:Flp pilus assembly protein TadG
MLKDERGTAVLEMAIVLPVLLALILGIIAYGDWFLVAHNVQQAANDAARSTIGGLTSAERLQMAVTSAQTDMRRAGTLDPQNATFAVDDDGTTLAVRIRYDASTDPLLNLSFVKTPSLVIERSAVVRLDSM